MRGVVPQKGFKMKISMNQGPYVDRTDYGFVMSTEHCKQLSDFLWDWKDSLPAQIACHVEVITINPTRRVNCPAAICIKVILSGGGENSWKAHFEQMESYSIRDGVNISANNLLLNLRSALRAELSKYQSVQNELASMIGKLDVHY
ncbi:MAG: hypothetical protein WBC83_00815 [Minisyncoccia bacterium]